MRRAEGQGLILTDHGLTFTAEGRVSGMFETNRTGFTVRTRSRISQGRPPA